jgi:hypothetical protein
MHRRVWRPWGSLTVVVFVLLGMGLALPTTGTSYDGHVPAADDDLPGALVLYVDLERDDQVDWSWESTEGLDFEITFPSGNSTITYRTDKENQGGQFTAEHPGMHRFAWYNDDPDHRVDIGYTIHKVQGVPVCLTILAIVVISAMVAAYGLWTRQYPTGGAAGQAQYDGEGEPPGSSRLPPGLTRAVIVGIVASLIAISAISLAYRGLEDLDAEEGSELVVTLSSTAPDSHVVWLTTKGPGAGDTVQFDVVELAGNQTARVLVLASPEWSGVGLTIELVDRTADTTDTRPWTPTAGERDELAFDVS